MASILILTSEARGEPTAFALVLVATAIVLIVAYVFLRASARLARLLGQTGYPNITRNEDGIRWLFRQFSFAGGIGSHVAPRPQVRSTRAGSLATP